MEDYNQRFAARCHSSFHQARAKLEEMVEQLYKPMNETKYVSAKL